MGFTNTWRKPIAWRLAQGHANILNVSSTEYSRSENKLTGKRSSVARDSPGNESLTFLHTTEEEIIACPE